MRQFSKIAVLVVAVALVAGCSGKIADLAAGCSRKITGKKVLSSEEVGKILATTLCDKYVTCQPKPDFNKDQCLQEISNGLTERLKTKTSLKLEQAMVDTCTKSIVSAACEVLNSEKPPQGCEFLD